MKFTKKVCQQMSQEDKMTGNTWSGQSFKWCLLPTYFTEIRNMFCNGFPYATDGKHQMYVRLYALYRRRCNWSTAPETHLSSGLHTLHPSSTSSSHYFLPPTYSNSPSHPQLCSAMEKSYCSGYNQLAVNRAVKLRASMCSQAHLGGFLIAHNKTQLVQGD